MRENHQDRGSDWTWVGGVQTPNTMSSAAPYRCRAFGIPSLLPDLECMRLACQQRSWRLEYLHPKEKVRDKVSFTVKAPGSTAEHVLVPTPLVTIPEGTLGPVGTEERVMKSHPHPRETRVRAFL